MTDPAPHICGATTHSDGHPCRNLAMRGQDRCRMHGGSTPGARRNAERRLLEADARKQLHRLGAVRQIDSPVRELHKLASEALALKDLLQDRVASASLTSTEAQAFERAFDRAERLLTNLARLNIEERVVALNEQETSIVVDAMGLFVASMGYDSSDPAVRRNIVLALRSAKDNAAGRDRVIAIER